MFPAEFRGTGRGWFEVIALLRAALLSFTDSVLKPHEDGLAIFYLRGRGRLEFGFELEQRCRDLLDREEVGPPWEVPFGVDEDAGFEFLRLVVEFSAGEQELIFVRLFEVDFLLQPTQW